MRKKKLLKGVIAFLMAVALCLQSGLVNVIAAGRTPSVKYSLHVQDKDWMKYVSDGMTSGTTGQSLRAEAIKISISGMPGGITYRTHIKDKGWTSWSSNNRQSGTTGKKLQMEAIQIELTGAIASKYDVYYRVHLAELGWLGWTKNGGVAGSTGCAIRMEAIQIKLSPKANPLTVSTSSVGWPDLKVRAHVQETGWQDPVKENQTAGTTGKGYRMEALQIQCSDFLGGNGIEYRAHVEDEGWQSWKTSGNTAGTTNKSKRMEAVEIKLTGVLSKVFDIYYRAHCADYGWLGWACNGESAGTTNGSKQMEAIQIKLVHKNTAVSRGGKAYYDLTGINNSNNNTGNTSTGSIALSYGLYKNTSARISCGFDGYTTTSGRHEGIDFVCSNGAPVYSLTDGVVVRVYQGRNGSGGLSTIAIYDEAANKTVVYLHSNPVSLKANQRISKGQQIATQGWRGVSSSSGSHTHVEVREGRQGYAVKSVDDPILENQNPSAYWASKGYIIR